MSRLSLPVLLSLAAGLAVTAPGMAQEPAPPPVSRLAMEGAEKSFFGLQIENDKLSGTDRHYTNGIRAVWVSAESSTPDWAMRLADAVPVFPAQGVRRYGISVGHSIFTPFDTAATGPLPDQRPYAGWLYGGLGFVSDTGTQLDFLELQLGVVGPSALGRQVQNDWHGVIGVDEARGWDNQLKDEIGVLLAYERKVEAWRSPEVAGFRADFTPHFGVSLGNVLTAAAAGGTFRVGLDLPQDYGPPRIRPALTGSTYFTPSGPRGWYLFAGVEGRAVARNIFLDGNTFRDSMRVSKVPFVGDVQAGIAGTIGDVRVAYTHVLRTREYRTQASADSFGSFSLSVRF
ncbi:MAG: lipid A deacylase LpxR family protein [Rhodospirillaceae bacterium]